MARRNEILAQLRHQAFDLLVIGGGIVGAGIARDAAMRGLRVALVEQGDFAGGTSSKTSKLIHGGLRYLEHGRLRLVGEGLQERSTLLTIAPGLVRPLSLLLPVYRGDARRPSVVRAGLTLYDLLSASHAVRRHRWHAARHAARLEPRLRQGGLQAMGEYTDGMMDDARLCLANILQAVSFGAICGNYLRVIALEKALGRLYGAAVEDRRTGEVFDVRATVVVNAGGPWGDRVRQLSDRQTGLRLAPTKGIHLVVPRLATHGVCFQAHADRRVIFLLPWGNTSILGTTESPVPSLDGLRPTRDEAAYLLDEANRLFPDEALAPQDVIGAYAGARPLLAFSGSSTSASREHRIEVDRFGLVSVLGGKYTTYRLIAQQTVDAIVRRWRFSVERCLTDQVSLLEPVHPVVLDRWQRVTQRIHPELLGRLLSLYGTGAFRVLELVEFEPKLAEPACPHHDYLLAELVYALQQELACTVSDVLVRRTRVAYSACQGLDFLSTLTELMGRYGHASREELDAQVAEYRTLLAESLAFRDASAEPAEAFSSEAND
ncbi:MAG: glycerol-3-phosphate dehydrogenase/oxidase [Candidatus Omnitrophica bacterium]|nr:glycerol-3-phosphate dehydrogenase/oxidase [Candidatus Omnitrophota bacterium]